MDKASTRSVWQTTTQELEAITLKIRKTGDNQATFTSYSFANAKRKKANLENIIRLGFTAKQKVTHWQLWQEWMDDAGLPAGTEPNVSDQIVDSNGIVFVIKIIERKLYGNVFDLYCLEAATSN